ncbi:MAG: hypothetical protein AAB461_02935 [Patescibacteria group bacterium]
MVFRRDGFLFKLAYNWNIDWRTDKIEPQKTNILKIFLLVTFALVFAWPFIIISRVFGWVVRIVGFLPALILFGYRPLGPSWRFFEIGSSENLLPFEPISRWPRFGQRRFLPGVIIFFGYLGYELFKNYLKLFKSLPVLLAGLFETTAGLWFLSVVSIFLTIFAVYLGVRNTERWRMAKEYIRTQKNRLLLTVEFK